MRAWLVVLLAGCAADASTPGDGSLPDSPIQDASGDRPFIDALDAPVDGAQIDAPDAAVADAAETDAGPIRVTCTTDDTTGIVAGSRSVASVGDFIPLCSGEVLLADRTNNEIVRENIVTGEILQTYPLPLAPIDMDLDPRTGMLYVAVSSIARIDLLSGTTTTISIPYGSFAVAVGPPGLIYVLGNGNGTNSPVHVIDSLTGAILQTVFPPASGNFMRYDGVGHNLVLGNHQSLYHLRADATTGLLTYVSQVYVGDRCDDMATSPTGGHLAYACQDGTTSGPSYVIDFDPSDLNTVSGAWNVGAYPVGAAFSPDGSSFASGNWTPLVETFTVATHVQTGSFSPSISCAGTQQISRVHFSRGARLLYSLVDCVPSGGTWISWFVLP